MSGKWFRRWHRLKWVGLAACLALLVPRAFTRSMITVKNTEVWLSKHAIIVFHQRVKPGVRPGFWGNWKGGILNDPGFLPEYRSVTLHAGKLIYISLPLQLPCGLLVIATSVLWWSIPRYPSGCCTNCGYNLTGNESGVCPECGKAI